MDKLKLAPDQEHIRSMLFPKLAAEEYLALLERQQAAFAGLPAREQRRLTDQLDEHLRELALDRARQRANIVAIAGRKAK